MKIYWQSARFFRNWGLFVKIGNRRLKVFP